MLTRRIFLGSSLGALAAVGSPLKLNASTNGKFTLTPKEARANFLEDSDVATDVWAFDGLVPGPVIRARKGEEIYIEVINQLAQATSIHWHGIRIENRMDGVSNLTQAPIEPGESFTYRFTVPDAGTYWYHPHNRTWEQLARGLYGALIVEGDAGQGAFDREYSIIADDWRLDDKGAIHEASLGNMRDWSHAGRLGNILTLNGKPFENLDVVPGERVRLRLTNAANARVMRFAIAGHEPWLVALDGQPIRPVALGESGVALAPAQRADLVLDIKGRAGDRIAIVETSGPDGLVAGYLSCRAGGVDTRTGAPKPLTANSVPEPDLENSIVQDLVMSGGAMRFLTSARFKGKEVDGRTLAREHAQVWAFNGQAGMAAEPLFSAKLGETVKMKLVNETAWPHSIHLHGHHFRIISRAGSSGVLSDAESTAFRDTVLLERDETVEIAFVADNPGKWMLHCHMLEHQASGMATWFEVS